MFSGVKGSQVGSTAQQTELIGNRIETSRLAVSAAAGNLLLEDNVLELAPGNDGRQAAVVASGDTRVVMRRNRLANDTGRPAALLLDWSSETPKLEDNVVLAGDKEVRSDGVWRHRMGALLHEAKAGVGSLLDMARQALGR